MNPRPIAYVLAFVLIAGALFVAAGGGATLGVARQSPGIAEASYGSGGAQYRFKRAPAGADSAAADCVVCHSVEKNGPARVAPNLWGIVGAPKARADWFAYSAALRKAGGVWTADELDKFLADPHKHLPGTSKTILGVKDDKKRGELIAYLKMLKD